MAKKTLQFRERSRELGSIVLAVALIAFLGAFGCSKKEPTNDAENAESTENANASPSSSAASPTETTSPTTSTSPSAAAPFQGTWTNKDPNARGITKLVITQNGSEVKVHAWGKCHPSDCDWGEEDGGIIDNAAVVTWDQKFVIRKMKLTIQGNELHSVTDSVYSDNRPRMKSEEVFVRQS